LSGIGRDAIPFGKSCLLRALSSISGEKLGINPPYDVVLPIV
jgi:hypothetical protein